MSVRTIEDHVESLLSRQVAEGKLGGTPRPDLEATAIFDSIALTFILNPRAAIYLMFLARNGLSAAVIAEKDLISQLLSVIDDLANQSYRIEGAAILQRARIALLNMENLPGLSANSKTLLTAYNNSVSEFLETHLSKSVRKKGSSELTRPASEALATLPGLVATLKSQHADVLDRLYTLLVGIDNFESAPFSSLLGTTTVFRVRNDLEDILSSLASSEGSPEAARDYAIRLLGSQATIDIVTRPPKWSDLVADAVQASSSAAPTITSTVPDGSYEGNVGDPACAISLTGHATLSFNLFPPGPCLVSDAASYPMTLAAGTMLYVQGDSLVTVEIPIDGTFDDSTELATKINTAATVVQAISFAGQADRLLLYSSPVQASLSILNDGTTPAPSGASSIGFFAGQTATAGLSTFTVVEAMNYLFGTLITASVDMATSRLTITSNFSDPGIRLGITCGPGYGLNGTDVAGYSDSLVFNQVDLTNVQLGDLVTTPTGAGVITGLLSPTSIRVDTSLETFTGATSVKSSMVESYKTFIADMKVFLRNWSSFYFAADLTKLDQVIAPLTASQSEAQRNEAKTALGGLNTQLTNLLNILQNQSTMLGNGAAIQERDIVNGVLATLQERGFQRAVDLLLKGDIQSMLEMDYERASYGGEVLRVSSSFAQSFSVEDPQDDDRQTAVSAGNL